MARHSKTLTPEAQAAFVAALQRGALVAAAAAEAGVQVSTLYCRRGRDTGFAAEWEAAVAASSGKIFVPARVRFRAPDAREERKAGTVPRLRARRRVRFSAERRALFLEAFAATCHTGDAAEAAGVDRSTVYRAIARDSGFARAVTEALRAGSVRLCRIEAQKREEAAARRREEGITPSGEPTQDFDHLMRLLNRTDRSVPASCATGG